MMLRYRFFNPHGSWYLDSGYIGDFIGFWDLCSSEMEENKAKIENNAKGEMLFNPTEFFLYHLV